MVESTTRKEMEEYMSTLKHVSYHPSFFSRSIKTVRTAACTEKASLHRSLAADQGNAFGQFMYGRDGLGVRVDKEGAAACHFERDVNQ